MQRTVKCGGRKYRPPRRKGGTVQTIRCWRGVAAVLAAASLTAALVAVASAGAADSASSRTADEKAFIAKVDALVAARSAKQNTRPPANGPKAVTGKRIFVIPCAMAAEGCARPARAALEAAKKIGWKATLIDPAGDPSKIAQAFERAVAQKADGIVLEAIDTKHIPDALAKAKGAGIKVVSFAAGNTPKLFDWTVPLADKDMIADGYLSGAAAFKASNYDLKIVTMTESFYQIDRDRQIGLKRFISECKTAGAKCELLGTTAFQLPEMATQGPTQAVALARNNADFNVFWGNFDAGLSFFVQGLRQAGLADSAKSFAIGFDANSANLDDIRSDGYQKLTIGLPAGWIGYAQIDALNRIFAGQKVVDQGIRTKLLSKTNLPPKGAWDGDFDARPAYLKVWGKK